MSPTLIHADIFFYITTIAVVVLTVLVIIFLYYVVKIARHLEHAAKRLKEESDHILDDVSIIRESMEDKGGKAVSFLKFVLGTIVSSKMAKGRKANDKGKKDTKN